MKIINKIIIANSFAALLLCACDQNRGRTNNPGGSGSATETTPNDSSGAESNSALGVGEGKQKEMSGYPSNQSNLNSDSTSRRHDPDTSAKKPLKDKSNRHQ
jgi:hypothetical protein